MKQIPMHRIERLGLSVSRVAFGAGPVSGLMTGDDRETQCAVMEAVMAAGINWIDTAAGYGNGRSEENLGHVLSAMSGANEMHVATKVRLTDEQLTGDIRLHVLRSVEDSLRRLQRSQVTLLQLHNGLTRSRGEEASSVAEDDVLRTNGIADAMDAVRDLGLCRFIGLTGTGQSDVMRRVIRSNRFDTIQCPFNILNPSAGQVMDQSFPETNYGNIFEDCLELGMGVFAIRVLAGGAIPGQPPSAHTLRTPYFPLDLYQRDTAAACQLMSDSECSDEDARADRSAARPKQAIRFVLAHPAVSSAIVGFGKPEHVATAAAFSDP